MTRLEKPLVVAATLAPKPKSANTVENATRFRNIECGQACLPVPQQRSPPTSHERMHKSALSRKEEKEIPQAMPGKIQVIVDGSRLIMLRVMGFTARHVAGTIALADRTPNGQIFVANSQQLCAVKSNQAVDGVDVGSPGSMREQTRLNEFRLTRHRYQS